MPDWLGQDKVGSNGIGVVLLSQDNPAMVWEVQQVGVTVSIASQAGNVGIFKNGNLVAPTSALVPQISPGSIASIGQTASGLPYVYIQASDILQIVVSSATADDTITVRAQYREIASNDPLVRGM